MFGSFVLVLQIIFLESILSMDNALVLAELARHLPKDKPVKFPGFLKFLEKFTFKAFGYYRIAFGVLLLFYNF